MKMNSGYSDGGDLFITLYNWRNGSLRTASAFRQMMKELSQDSIAGVYQDPSRYEEVQLKNGIVCVHCIIGR